jgi:hypothetical protein
LKAREPAKCRMAKFTLTACKGTQQKTEKN